MFEQIVWRVERIPQEMPQSLELKPLAQNGSSLESRLVIAVEPIEPSLHEALHRTGNFQGADPLLRLGEELLQEQRISCGPLDAAFHETAAPREESARERPCILELQRPEIERDQRRFGNLLAPPGTKGVAFTARGHGKHGRAVGGRGRDCREVGERHLVGPVKILDDDEDGPITAYSLYEGGGCGDPPSAPGLVVHGIRESSKLGRLRQIKEVV